MKTARIVLLVGAVGLAARLICAFAAVPRFESVTGLAADPDRYAELATSLLDRGELGFNPPDASPTTVRGPGFPGWIAAGALFGRSLRWLGFWAGVPGLAAAIAIAFLLARTHGPAAALTGGLVAAAHPLPCFFSARLLPDEAYGAWVFLGSAAWIAATRSSGGKARFAWAASAGILLAAAALTRPSALGVVAILVLFTIPAGARALAAAAVATILVAVPVGAWTLRTTALAGHPTFVESLAGYNFWLGESAFRSGFASGFAESRRRAYALIAEEGRTPEVASASFRYAALSPRQAAAFDETLRRSAREFALHRPLRYLGRVAEGVLWFWIRADSLRTTLAYAAIALPVLALALAGLGRATILPWSIVLAHVLLYAAIYPMARYSVEVYPAVAYLAGIGLAHGGRKLVDHGTAV